MSTGAAPLDVFACRLDGVNLVEASAGTGKTWNICGLYMRLLLERHLEVRQILVVTFTNAATAELRERVRSRIADTLAYVAGRGPETHDPFVQALVAAAETAGVTRGEIRDRLDLALQTFDEAAISTIHGFCQRALADASFSAGVPFALELLPNDDALHLEVAQDFWRKHVAGADCHPAFAAYLAQKKDDPIKLAALLRKRVAKPLARLEWPEDIDRVPVIDPRALQAAFGAARATWTRERAAIENVLKNGLGALNKNTYKAERLSESFADWDTYFAAGDPYADPARWKLDLCRASRLARATNQGKSTPTHAFCDEADTLFDARAALEAELALARLRLVRELLDHGPEEVRKRKRQKRVLGYDDIIYDLYAALHGRDAVAVASSLRERFPAALVDEFQDTDPVQFGIFRAIYGHGEVPLFLVGDPKQAIYSFRNADLYTYLEARRLATAEHTLDANQRSTGNLIAAVNALFEANSRAFMLPGLVYHAVREGAKPREPFRDASGSLRADACAWLLPTGEDGRLIARQAAFDASARATTGEIARLLREARAGRITYGDRALAPGDIAVLVRSHAHATRMRDALRAVGVGSVELAQTSVFASKDAGELERVLLAIVDPARAGYVKTALATEILGYDANAIEAIAAEEAALAAHMDAFARYRETWLTHGFGVMYRRFLAERNVGARMLARSDGERRLTNLLHLGERLQEASAVHAAPDALLQWFGAARQEDSLEEAAQLRLESDRNLVQIVTVHKAKGLEYPVVFCPFLWDGYRRNNKEWPATYHDAQGTAVLDFRDEQEQAEAAKARAQLESLAETVRLLYVALTRASHRCYLVAGCYGTHVGAKSAKESARSILNWLVAGARVDPEDWCDSARSVPEILAAWHAVAAASGGKLAVGALPVDAPEALREELPAAESLRARVAPAALPHPWRIGSYSALSFDAAGEAAAVDHDLRVAPVPATPPPLDLPERDILAFPRGPLAGECLHAALEHADFTNSAAWPQVIEAALRASPFAGHRAVNERLSAMIGNMLRDVTSTLLPSGIRLAEVPKQRKIAELEFNLPSPGLSAHALNTMLARHGYEVPRLAFADLNGYLKGFIDLVFEHGGRYYIVDWKSNHLGYTNADYGADAIAQAMVEHGYHLQHLLYSLALHRFLSRRIAGYTFDTHFGGVLYLFVRGVRPDWRTPEGDAAGVYFHRLAWSTLAELDHLFALRQEALAS